MENKKSTLPLAAFIIGLVTYNAALFVIAGFSHGAAFYTSYVFMLLAFASIIFAAVMAFNINAELSMIFVFAIPVLGAAIFFMIKFGFPRFKVMLKKYDLFS